VLESSVFAAFVLTAHAEAMAISGLPRQSKSEAVLSRRESRVPVARSTSPMAPWSSLSTIPAPRVYVAFGIDPG
jgi:hypothetical protein